MQTTHEKHSHLIVMKTFTGNIACILVNGKLSHERYIHLIAVYIYRVNIFTGKNAHMACENYHRKNFDN